MKTIGAVIPQPFADLYLSTLRNYVEGVGGKLTLIARFPDGPPVILSGLGLVLDHGGDRNEDRKPEKKKSARGAKPKAKTRRAA